MIEIANPLANETTSKRILKMTIAEYESKKLVSGIKACQKLITSNTPGKLLVLSAKTSPMDLITHLPILCENRNIPYIL